MISDPVYSIGVSFQPVIISIFTLRRYFFRPLGLKLGIKHSKVRKVQSNTILENAYQNDARWKQNDVLGLAKRIDWTERQVLRWLRVRRMVGKPTTLVKFCENRLIFPCLS